MTCWLSRDQIYIANVIKCRPPNNRDPEPDEVETCKPFLMQQIQLIKPKLVCTLGNWATQTLGTQGRHYQSKGAGLLHEGFVCYSPCSIPLQPSIKAICFPP